MDITGFLIDRYARADTRNVSWKTICREVLPGYEPGRLDLPAEKRNLVNSTLELMQAGGYVVLRKYKKEKSFTIYSLTMTEKMEFLCASHGVMTKKACAARVLRTLSGISTDSEEISEWKHRQIRLAQEGRPDRNFWRTGENPSDVTDAVKMADAVFLNREPVYIRDISKRVLGNSKAFSGKVKKKAEALLEACASADILEELERKREKTGKNAGILDLFGVMQTPQMIPACGSFEIFTDCGIINSCSMPYIFVSDVLDRYKKIRVRTPKFITIENKTTYEDFDTGGQFTKFFVGGFPGYAEKELLSKIYTDNPDIEFFHWGDIDCGGFRIFDNVRGRIPVLQPFRMDIETLKASSLYTEPLTANDRIRLSEIKGGDFAVLAKYMLDHNVKLEQESFYA